MIFSMTGYGSAQLSGTAETGDSFLVQAEVRAVNNRHLKLAVRGSEPYPLLEAEIEKVVRRFVRRGSLLVQIRVQRTVAATEYHLNEAVLRGYLDQLARVQRDFPLPQMLPALFSGVLALPGVTGETSTRVAPPAEEWTVVEQTLEAALSGLNQSRQIEGQAMADELLRMKEMLAQELTEIEAAIPSVLVDYRQRLFERIQAAILQAGVTLKPDELIRELAIYADRTDVSEEVTRLKNHLIQYEEVLRNPTEGVGRRLEFISQEIAREVNTTGSKAGSVAISKRVVEMKATLERIRELIQNVE